MVAPDRNSEDLWTLWFETRPEESKTASIIYQDRLLEVCSMDSVQQWSQYNAYMIAPETLPVHSTVYVFRNKVRPMWESFPDGGCWTIIIPRSSDRLQGLWEKLTTACTGDGLGCDNVAGIVLGSRVREFVISVWLTSGRTSLERFAVVDRLREVWQLREGDVIQFKDFHTAVQDNSARMNAVTYRVRGPKSGKDRSMHKKKYILPDPVVGSFSFQY